MVGPYHVKTVKKKKKMYIYRYALYKFTLHSTGFRNQGKNITWECKRKEPHPINILTARYFFLVFCTHFKMIFFGP